MKTTLYLSLCLLLIFPQSVSAQENKPSDYSNMSDEYMDIMNDYRLSIGLEKIILDDEMSVVAKKHSKEMADGEAEFSHVGFGERCSKSRMIMRKGNLCGEIIAYGQRSAQRVFSAWMGSPGHKAKIVERRYTHTGFGHYRSKTGRIYWTQIFLEVN